VTFTVDALVEPVRITSPAEGEEVTDTTPTIEGTGEPGAEVALTIDGEAAGTATVDADGTWSFTPEDPLGCGEHTVTATQDVGTAEPSTVTFTVECPEALPDSGAAGSMVPAGWLGLVLLTAGGALVASTRRRLRRGLRDC
jgi:VCBS repeat-containing protein